MSGRPIVSYDDITLPYDQPEGSSNNTPSSSHSGQAPSPQAPPPKKRKRNNHNNHNQKSKRREEPTTAFKKSNSNSHPQSLELLKHSNNSNHYSVKVSPSHEPEGDGEEGVYEEDEEEESRELTHEEIWDDSALIDVWNAAMEEYEAFHGPDKDWKKEPVNKSPLWYNVPIDPSKKSTASVSKRLNEPTDDTETDSKPLDFDTFVPTHDPTLDISSAAPHLPPPPTTNVSDTVPGANTYIPDPSGPMVSQDEAFQRALSAMYWGGYWTAMYHVQRQIAQPQHQLTSTTTPEAPVSETEELAGLEEQEEEYEGEVYEMNGEGEVVEEEEDEEEEFVATQR